MSSLDDFKQILKNADKLTTDDELRKADSLEMRALKEIITIERRHLYGMDSSSAAKRREAIEVLISDKLKNRGR